MTKYIRYSLATFCFAASIGCVGLWWRSHSVRDLVFLYLIPGTGCVLDTDAGEIFVETSTECDVSWQRQIRHLTDSKDEFMLLPITACLDFEKIQNRGRGLEDSDRFEWGPMFAKFPLWYPALMFALAGVGVLRFRRQFSIRSALVATTSVAALAAMGITL